MGETEKYVRDTVERVGGYVDAERLSPANGGCWDISLFAPQGMTWDGVDKQFVCTSWMIAQSRIRRAVEKLGGPKPATKPDE